MKPMKIGTAERRDGDIDAGWISGQVNVCYRDDELWICD